MLQALAKIKKINSNLEHMEQLSFLTFYPQMILILLFSLD